MTLKVLLQIALIADVRALFAVTYFRKFEIQFNTKEFDYNMI